MLGEELGGKVIGLLGEGWGGWVAVCSVSVEISSMSVGCKVGAAVSLGSGSNPSTVNTGISVPLSSPCSSSAVVGGLVGGGAAMPTILGGGVGPCKLAVSVGAMVGQGRVPGCAAAATGAGVALIARRCRFSTFFSFLLNVVCNCW